jgi:hypothetical protein
MKFHPLILVGAFALALGGCATPFRAPSDVAHIQLDRVGSAAVEVDKIWLQRKHGPLVVTGSVIKRLEAEDTTHTHLDVTLYDAAGQVLRRSVEHFEPRALVKRPKELPVATYRVILDPLPPGTVRIEVKAHDGSPEHQ